MLRALYPYGAGVSCDFLPLSVDPTLDATLTLEFVSDPPAVDDFWADDPATKPTADADENDSLPAPPVAPRAPRARSAAIADVLRPTRAEVRLSHLRHNLAALRRHTRAQLWCVLKADAYGHGAKACARTLERAGADGLCVALIEEAIELREAGVNLPILVMSGYFGASRAELIHYRLTPVIHSPGQLEELEKEADYLGSSQVPYHLKIDTGMGRLGIPPRDLAAVLREVHRCRHLSFEGLMTHFASADTDPESVAEQLRRFALGEQEILAHGLKPKVKHAANTAALIGFEAAHFDIVRPGIGIYGVEPAPGFSASLRPAMRLLSTVIALRELQSGQTVGYGGSFTASRASKIATLPIGYADGFGRQHSNRGHVLIRGKRAPIVGRVSMDLTTVDVTDLPGVAVGDEAVIFGEQTGPLGTDIISAQDIATIEGTIPWEALTSVSRRVPRFYRDA
jgi:alanine racemase